VARVLNVFEPDIIQFPLNVFDQRFIDSGIIDRMVELNIERHVRSAFLQGILLQKSNEVDPFFNFISHFFQSYEYFLIQHDMTHLMSALYFVLNNKKIDRVILGVCSNEQLNQIINEVFKLKSDLDLDYKVWKFHDERLINPLSWPMLKK
jgi:aryl-alcohol dehydrogenase-like predicted oxidoreductase